MAYTNLKIFNMALAEIGQASILATGEAGLNPAALGEIYDDTRKYCLEQGYWNFAINTAELATQGGVVLFGYTYPYQKPSGWKRTVRLSASNTYWPPLEDYEDAQNQIHANVSPLYAAFVATDGGFPLTNWPDSYATYVSCELAYRISKRIGAAQDEREAIEKRRNQTLSDALTKDAMNEGVRYPPEGRWVMSRRGSRRGDRGNRGSLTG